MPDDEIDTELEVWDQFVTAVRWLARGPRPGLTLATATEEALMGWAAEQAALEHGSEPFNEDEPVAQGQRELFSLTRVATSR